jgi:hypothetical protein
VFLLASDPLDLKLEYLTRIVQRGSSHGIVRRSSEFVSVEMKGLIRKACHYVMGEKKHSTFHLTVQCSNAQAPPDKIELAAERESEGPHGDELPLN